MANEKTSDYAVLPSGTILDTYLFDIANPGALNYKGTALELKNYIGTGQEGFDATVGAVGSGADYNLVQDAIDASKVNLLIIGDYTNSETVVLGVNFISITIAKKWTMNEGYVTIGAGGLKIQGGVLEGIYTITANKMFLSSASCTLQMHNLSGFMISSTIANAGIADLTSGSKHIINNCNFALSNTAECGFKNAGDSSSFTNLNVIGGGIACDRFIKDMQGGIISNLNLSGIVKDGADFITAKDGAVIISNIKSTITQEFWVTGYGSSKLTVSNLYGSDGMNFAFSSSALLSTITNCTFKELVLNNNDSMLFSNVRVVGTDLIEIEGSGNVFVNCKFNPAVTQTGTSNNNHLLLCSVTGVYTDNGTNNSFTTDVSEDETLSADSNRLLCSQKAIKTYADNIAKGITVDYYFSDTPDGVIANYDLMYPADTGQVESNVNNTIAVPDTLIASFVTQTTEPNFTTLLAGIYDIHIHASKSAVPKDVFIYAKFYKRTHPGGVETLLSTSDNSALLATVNTSYTIHFSLLADEVLDPTDRLVVKFYGTPSGAGANPTANLWLEGSNASRIDIHTTSSSWMLNLQNIIYVNGAGNDSNDGKNMGTPKLTIASALTAAAAQTPSSTKIVVVKVLGGQRYAEDVTIPSWVVLDMSDALSYGQVTVGVTMGADSFYYFNEALMPSGKESIRCTGTGIRYIKGNFTTPETSSTFLTASGGATIYLDIVSADAVKTGATFYTLTTGAVLFLKAQTFRETVASTSVGSTVFRQVVDDGTNADTTNINTTGNNIIRGKDKVILGNSIGDILEVEGATKKWLTPSFIATLSATATDVTGDATLYTMICDTEIADIGGHYNNATGVFTAPTTGLYQFDLIQFLKDLTASHTDLEIFLNVAGGTPQNWLLFEVNAANVRRAVAPYYIALTGSTSVKLNSGDAVTAKVRVSNGTKVVDVETGTKFSGRLLTKT